MPAPAHEAPVLYPPTIPHEVGDAGVNLTATSFAVLESLVVKYGHSGPSQYGGPETGGFDQWYKDIQGDRDYARNKINYQGGVFDQVKWTRRAAPLFIRSVIACVRL